MRRWFDLTRDRGPGVVDSHRVLIEGSGDAVTIHGHENITHGNTPLDRRGTRPHPSEIIHALLDTSRRHFLDYDIAEISEPGDVAT